MSALATPTHLILLIVGLLVFLSVLGNRVSDRFGMPVLLMFLGVGMLAGSDGIGRIHFDNPAAANLVGVFALAFILFAGGLDTEWRSVRPVLGRAAVLSTLGVVLTALLVGGFAWGVLGMPAKDGLLLGAIVSSTDAAAVFGILRSRGVGLRGNLKPLLELESGSNDPMAVFLTVGILGVAIDSGAAWLSLLPNLGIELLVGIVAGAAAGRASAWLLNRLQLGYEGLYPVLSISIVLLTYGLSAVLHGNGFLSVYVCGILLGNRDFPNKRFLARFHDGLSWLMQILLFLALGLLAFPSRLPKVAGPALALSAFLMLVARPLAVYAGLWRSAFSLRERTLVAWTGLRGAVPIVLATFPYLSGYPNSEHLFTLVFFIVLTSVLLQGKSLMLVARWLGVDEPLRARPRSPLAFERGKDCQNDMREVELSAESVLVGQTVARIRLPGDVLILLIRRGNEFVIPRGPTMLQAFDTLMLFGRPDALSQAREHLLTPHPAPDAAPATPP